MNKPKVVKTLEDIDISDLGEADQELVNSLKDINRRNKKHHESVRKKMKTLRSEAKEIQNVADKINSQQRR